jgi:hypothetical protein
MCTSLTCWWSPWYRMLSAHIEKRLISLYTASFLKQIFHGIIYKKPTCEEVTNRSLEFMYFYLWGMFIFDKSLNKLINKGSFTRFSGFHSAVHPMIVFLGFDTAQDCNWMLMLHRNVLSPSLGLLNCILVDSEGLNNRKCWDYTGNTGYGLAQETSPLIFPWFWLTTLLTTHLYNDVNICMNVFCSPCKMGAAHSSENISIKLWSYTASNPKRLPFEALSLL